jgi:hypothetical protein
VKKLLCLLLLLTLNPTFGNCQPKKQPIVVATAYCLRGHTSSGPRTFEIPHGCIALSRKLAQDLGLKKGKGEYDYCFGTKIEVIGVGIFTFADLMPKKWKYYRVDIYYPTLRECHVFGLKRCQVRVVK